MAPFVLVVVVAVVAANAAAALRLPVYMIANDDGWVNNPS